MKKTKYSKAASEKLALFTPIIASCESICVKEAKVYLKRLATMFSKNGVTYLKARMQICILRSVSLCLRESRKHWRRASFVDAASLLPNVQDIEQKRYVTNSYTINLLFIYMYILQLTSCFSQNVSCLGGLMLLLVPADTVTTQIQKLMCELCIMR